MGIQEKEIAKKVRRVRIQNIILGSLAIGGLISLALLAPGTLQVLKQFDKQRIRKKDPHYIFNDSLRRLKERGLIEIIEKNGKKFTQLTTRGQIAITRIPRLYQKNLRIKPKRWDGKWRLVIFDIKENRRGIRDGLRSTLSRIGFVKLQQSVWVYPYDCEDLIMLLKTDYKIGKDILYMIVDTIEGDYRLKKIFNLKNF